MKREIKFRGWIRDGKRMIYANLDEIAKGIWSSPLYWCDLTEYTGLKDKNGKDIYIGDVMAFEVETTEGIYRVDHYEVIINDFMQIPVIDSERGQGKLYEYHNIGTVVGNVFDMPDWNF